MKATNEVRSPLHHGINRNCTELGRVLSYALFNYSRGSCLEKPGSEEVREVRFACRLIDKLARILEDFHVWMI
jgi:hypothetical protein